MSFILINNSKSFAFSKEFEYLIEVMSVDASNVHGKQLNEEVYNQYSLFVYGSPIDGYSGQRWKNVKDGHWMYKGNKGEFWILGENKEGYEVHNHKFPADIEPPTTPENWRYAYISDAKDSWLDQSKYMDDYQKEYMQSTKLTRNDVEYNITALDIGLDKVRLENYATWKTKGSVYTQRYDMNNRKWAANFMVPPMAADASLEGFANFPDGMEYVIGSEEDDISIPIEFGANVTNLSEYALPEHIKNISSELYINNKLVTSISDTESLGIRDALDYVVYNNDTLEIIELNIEVKSKLLTKFTTDGALVDVKEYKIIIYRNPKEPVLPVELVVEDIAEENDFEEIPSYINRINDENHVDSEDVLPPVIQSIKVTKETNGIENGLLTNKRTNTKFVCAGQTIKITATIINDCDRATISFAGDSSIFTFDETTKNAEWIEPKARGLKTFFRSLNDFKKMYRNNIIMENVDGKTQYSYTYIIPYETKQTLNSWATLREKSDNALSIDESKLFTRIINPYEIVIKATGYGGTTTKRMQLDVFERWDTIYNRDISNYVVSD